MLKEDKEIIEYGIFCNDDYADTIKRIDNINPEELINEYEYCLWGHLLTYNGLKIQSDMYYERMRFLQELNSKNNGVNL